jgi:hypothetical protein
MSTVLVARGLRQKICLLKEILGVFLQMPWHVPRSSELSFSAHGPLAGMKVRIISASAYLLARTSRIQKIIRQANGLMERSDFIKLKYFALIDSS